MHEQMIPPATAIDPEDEVEDILRLTYRSTPPRGLPPRLQDLMGRLREAMAADAEAQSRPHRRAGSRGSHP